ncbi:MAG: exodeoxyribonuclease V subunit gamma [Psychromonas sp.]|nr:exodeoxyribonuclease V subunit gamma [Psychromonas sp.]
MNETVIVHSPGVAQWLNLAIAQSMGIAANIDFPSPDSFIWKQFNTILSDLPEQNPFNIMSMTWHIMKILPECLV